MKISTFNTSYLSILYASFAFIILGSSTFQLSDAQLLRSLKGKKDDSIIPEEVLDLINSFSIYTDLQDVPNLPWDKLITNLTVGANSFGPAYGSTIRVNKDNMIRQQQNQQQKHKDDEINYFEREVDYADIRIHTVTNSFIPRSMFHTMTRWYMEDGNTQIFRMFPNEDNIRNQRKDAPRVEAFSLTNWRYGDGMYEFSAAYTFMNVRDGAVFQLKHNHTYWSMQLIIEENKDNNNDRNNNDAAVVEPIYDLYYVKLRDLNAKTLLAHNVQYKTYDIKVLDDGLYQQVYVNGEHMVIDEIMDDRTGTKDAQNSARWGFYSPGSPIDRDILIFVTGAYVGQILDQ